MVDGFNMYLEENKSEFAGAKVKVIVEDSTGQAGHRGHQGQEADPVRQGPHAGRRRAGDRGLCARPGQHQRQDRLHRLGARGRRSHPARPAEVSLSDPHRLDELAAASRARAMHACDHGYKKVVAIAADYAFGHESVGGFQKAFEDCGGQVVQKIWPPFGTKDFGPYIPTIKADADALFTLMVGPMVIQFPKQLRQSGYKKPIVGGGTSYDEFALPFMGDEVIGDISALQYSAALDTPKNAAFVKTYRTKYGKVPSYFSETMYTTGAADPRGDEGEQGCVAGRRAVRQADGGAQDRRRARAGRVRRHAQPGAQHLHQEGREEEDVRLRQGRALEHRDQDLSERRPVLDLRQGCVPQAAGLFAATSRPANSASSGHAPTKTKPRPKAGAFCWANPLACGWAIGAWADARAT